MDTSSLVNLYDRLDSQKDQVKNTSSYNFGDREPDPPSKKDDLEINDNLPMVTDDQPMSDTIKNNMFHNQHLFRDPEDDLPVGLRPDKISTPVKISLSDDTVNRMRALNRSYDDPMSRQYAYDYDDRWREKLNKHCDSLKDKFCRHILVDMYCKIIPLDHDYVCKHQQRMANDIDDFLANKGMTSYQYLTAAKENTKAPLIDFILREADRTAKEYYERCCKKIREDKKKGINRYAEEANTDFNTMQAYTIGVRENPEYIEAAKLLYEKTLKKAVSDVKEIVDSKDQYPDENKQDPMDSFAKQVKDKDGQVKDDGKEVKKTEEKKTKEEKEAEDNEKAAAVVNAIKEETKKELVQEYADAIRAEKTKKELNFETDEDLAPNKDGIALQRQIKQDRELNGNSTSSKILGDIKEVKKESVISLCLDYANRELITENVEMTSQLNEELIGIAIRESTLSQIDRLFKFTLDPTKNLQTKLFLNKSPLMNKQMIKSLIK